MGIFYFYFLIYDKNLETYQPTGTLQSLSDSLMNSLSKIKKPDERFIEIKNNVEKLVENLKLVDKHHSKINKSQSGKNSVILGFREEYENLSLSFTSLSTLESNISSPLKDLSSTFLEYSKLINELVNYTLNIRRMEKKIHIIRQ